MSSFCLNVGGRAGGAWDGIDIIVVESDLLRFGKALALKKS